MKGASAARAIEKLDFMVAKERKAKERLIGLCKTKPMKGIRERNAQPF